MRARSPAAAACLLGALLSAALCAPATAADDRAPLAGVVLEDPGGRSWDLDALVGQPVLLVVADRGASGKAVDWGRGIAAARPHALAPWASPGTVAILSVADLRGVPGFARGTARWIIAALVGAQAGQGGPPLLLDWDGKVAVPIAALDGVPNVRLYAADGRLVLGDSGDPTADAITRLAAAIDGLVAAAQASAAAPTPTAAAETR
jgi:hypothetical protein